jgi:isoleucyl-tRNA synthetase
MKFKANTRRRAIEYEKDLVKQWKDNKTFEKSVAMRPIDNSFVFYDGPPFITGVPHHGTLLSSVVKDVIPRYQTMKGKRVERVWGWDCHGLPAENYVEKKLGITDRHDIGTKISLEDYITTARESMVQTSGLWEDTIDRIGRWVNFKGAYKTMDKKFMESVWWAFKTLYEKGKIYEGERVLMYDTKWATPLSKAEVTMDAGAYIDVTDPSVFVKFKMKTAPKSYLMGVGEIDDKLKSIGISIDSISDNGSYRLTIPEDKLSDYERLVSSEMKPEYWNEYVFDDEIVFNFKHADSKIERLVYDKKTSPETTNRIIELCNEFSKSNDSSVEHIIYSNDWYRPTYLLAWTTTPWTLPANTALAVNEDVEYVEVELENDRFILAKETIGQVLTDAKHDKLDYKIIRMLKGKNLVGKTYEPLFGDRGENAHKIWSADYVTTESGTGIVHIAPAYGEEDFELARKNKIPVIHVLDEYGKYTETEWIGNDIWDVNKTIAKTLLERGIVWKIDYIRHEYPHNPRTGNRLIYRAHPSWFIDIDDQRTEMLEENTEHVNWFPEHFKHGRFEKTIEQAPDWNLSRDRFWATAMPVWKGVDNDGKEHIKVIGSYAELKELSGVELEDYHRPWVDDIKFETDGVKYSRIDKVLDCWFESGSMPFAQFHYPFENVEKFEANFPGDFIVEYVGQVRAWFYYVHAVSVGIFGHNAFKNVIVTGNIAGNDGFKMSKSRGNFTDPNELMDKYSADSWRFLLLSSPLLNGEDFALLDKDVNDTARKLSMIWNMYDFFTMYAEVDDWEFKGDLSDPTESLTNPMDQWIVSRVHQLVAEVTKFMDVYNIPDATKPILPFIEDASNWYVRRSRRRFWKAGDDTDKNNAYRTLHYVLVQLAQVLAPFTPFLAEELYQKLTGGESVHLLDWPIGGHVNELVVSDMETVREYVNTGLSIRAKEHQKVRQPLASVTIPTLGKFVDFADILREELNVKEVKLGDEFSLDLNITPGLKNEGLAREVIRYIQTARKDAGLNIDDRIELVLNTNNAELSKAIEDNLKVITDETLATELSHVGKKSYAVTVKIDDASLDISLQKQL